MKNFLYLIQGLMYERCWKYHVNYAMGDLQVLPFVLFFNCNMFIKYICPSVLGDIQESPFPSFHLSVRLSICLGSATSPKQILMKFYTDVVYNLRICIQEKHKGPQKIKGDNSRESYQLYRMGISFVIWLIVVVLSEQLNPFKPDPSLLDNRDF